MSDDGSSPNRRTRGPLSGLSLLRDTVSQRMDEAWQKEYVHEGRLQKKLAAHYRTRRETLEEMLQTIDAIVADYMSED